MRVRDCTLIAVVIIVILLAGEAISYVSNPFSTSSELHSDGDVYTLYMDSNYSTEYTVVVTETEANSSDRHLYIYRDPDYASFIEDSYLDYWIEKMEAEFEVYNFSDYTVLNAEGLRDMMAGSIYNGAADETAIIMLTGALPDTVYGEEDSIYEMWLAAGGFVYWSGQSMGMMAVSRPTGMTPAQDTPRLSISLATAGVLALGSMPQLRAIQRPYSA